MSFEEMTGADDQPRASWAPVWAWLNNLSRRQLAETDALVQAELTEQEITGSVADAEDGTERLWQLDSVPFVLDHGEWETLVDGLRQRARVLEAVLQDLYGARSLLRQDWFPSQLLYEHPGYLRPAIGSSPERFLHCYAADLVRGPDGRWQVLADRCRAPFGLGYALQNRLVLGRSLPDLMQRTHTQALAPFYNLLVDHLRAQSPDGDGRVVLFGSQSLDGTNYEQAFLARYLDIDLVTSDDLTVRDSRLWLKTLGGLTPIDVMLRFVDDQWCDPLHFRPDSQAGVPGLIDAIRNGNLVAANALGSGVIDSPGLLSCTPRCAAHFGFADAGLPAIDSHWCGGIADPGQLETRLQEMVLLSTWHGLRQRPLLFDKHTQAQQRSELLDRVIARPAAFTALDRVQPSAAPAWVDGVLGQHAVILRLFLLADTEQGFVALPGGLVRSAANPTFAYAGIRHGGTSKDVWVPTADDSKIAGPLLRPRQRGYTSRSALDLPSSRLDDLFWLGRTAENLGHLARILRVGVATERARTLGERAAGSPVIDALCDLYAASDPQAPMRPQHQRLLDLAMGTTPATSMRQQLEEMGRLVRNTRAYLSGDTWLLVQELRQHLQQTQLDQQTGLSRLDRLAIRFITAADGLTGSLTDNMMRDHAWTFVELGRRLQRALVIAQMLAAAQSANEEGETADPGDLLALMEIAASAVTWRSRYSRPADLAGLLDLVGSHNENPRSVSFQFDAISRLLRGLPGLDALDDRSLHVLETARAALHTQAMDSIPSLMRELSDSIDHRWFSHALSGRSVDRSQEVN